MSTTDIVIRLLAAVFAGGALGLNRDLHKKAAGVRTIGVASLGSALVVLAAGGMSPNQPGFDSLSHVIQGVMTGVCFIGAGVIVRGNTEGEVHGLTTAAVIWLAAGFGVLCALGAWTEVAAGLALAFLLLMVGGRVEKWVERTYGYKGSGKPGDDGKNEA